MNEWTNDKQIREILKDVCVSNCISFLLFSKITIIFGKDRKDINFSYHS